MDYHLVYPATRWSALSAYGMARGFRWNFPLLALMAGSLVLIAAACAWFLSRPILLPRYPLLLVVARPSVLHAAFSAEQRAALPIPWGRALATKSHLPAVLSVGLDEAGTPHAFAALPGQSFGGEQLPTVSVARWSLPHFWQSFRADAAFALRGDLLTSWALGVPLEENPHAVATGLWKDGVGRIELRAEDSDAMPSLAGQLVGVFGNDPRARELSLLSLLSQGVDLRGISRAPVATSLALSPLGNRALTLVWDTPLSEMDRDRIFLAGGEVSAEGNQALFWDAVTTTSDHAPSFISSPCPGAPQFTLEGVALQRVLEALHAPVFLRDHLSAFSLTLDDGALLTCFHN